MSLVRAHPLPQLLPTYLPPMLPLFLNRLGWPRGGRHSEPAVKAGAAAPLPPLLAGLRINSLSTIAGSERALSPLSELYSASFYPSGSWDQNVRECRFPHYILGYIRPHYPVYTRSSDTKQAGSHCGPTRLLGHCKCG